MSLACEDIGHTICIVVESEIPKELGRVIFSDLLWRSIMCKRKLPELVLESHRRVVFEDLVQICDILAEKD